MPAAAHALPNADGDALAHALRRRLEIDTGQPVALVETHVSWVLLTERLAYKLKKPVRLGFVDFRSLAARRHFCEEEVRLNSRLAPGLYLGVVPVCGTVQAPHLHGGEPIDHAVCMRRFPDGLLLSELAPAGRIDGALIDDFAGRLAAFHAQAEVAAPLSEFGGPRQIAKAMTDVMARLRCEVGAPRTRPLQRWLAEQRQALRTAWRERQRHGAVRECHGDLHGANVVLLDGQLTAFDGLEFDPGLRWIDVMSDLAFLTMDLQAHDRADLAFRLLDGWLQHSGDYAGLSVLRCYEVYRALVRALVQALRRRAGHAPPGGAPDYLAWAERHAQPPRGARLLITHGVSGSGKSTIASALLAEAGAIRVRSDVERKRLFGLSAQQRSDAAALDIYTPEATRRTFQRLADCARTALLAGWPVIVDAAFLRREERAAFRRLATELRVPFSILHCHAAPAQLQARVAARGRAGVDASEATPQVLARQLAGYEPLEASERACVLEAVTDEAVNVAMLCDRWLAAGKAA